MRYIPLILFLIFSISCQTIKSQKQARKGWQKVDKEWLGQQARAKSPATIRKLSARAGEDSYEMIVASCKCTNHTGNRKTIDITETGTSELIISKLQKKCADDMLKSLGLQEMSRSRLSVHGCSSHGILVYFDNN